MNAFEPPSTRNAGVASAILLLVTAAAQAADPLPSWNDGPSRQAITGFAARVTKEGSSDFVPIPERIAVFDNDGTLWGEQPLYVQFFFIVDRIRQLAPDHPEWKTTEPFASVLREDFKSALGGGDKAIVQLMAATHAGMTTDEFAKTVSDWIATAKHPKTGRRFTEMVYQPMLEVLAYLRASGFKTYIVSGGGVEFMRPWTEKVYGIPPEQVVGTYGQLAYEFNDGKPVILKLAKVELIDDKRQAGRHSNLHWSPSGDGIRQFGRRPADA